MIVKSILNDLKKINEFIVQAINSENLTTEGLEYCLEKISDLIEHAKQTTRIRSEYINLTEKKIDEILCNFTLADQDVDILIDDIKLNRITQDQLFTSLLTLKKKLTFAYNELLIITKF